MTAFAEPWPLDWIDAYVARLRGYVVVRAEDALLIKVPNEAHKLNAAGVAVLGRLLEGETVEALWRSYGGTAEVRRDLYHFFVGLKQVLQGCVDEQRLPPGVVRRPFALGFSELPVLSEVALTYRCNLRCRFCYAGCGCHREAESPELATADVKRVLDAIRNEAQVPSVSFTGGEPTLRADLPELVRYAAADLGLRVNLISNGTLIDAGLAARLREAGLASAQVSLEAPDAARHDALTGAVGSFARSVAAVGHLREAGIRVHTNTTLNRENLAAAERMPWFVRELGLERFSMNLVIPAGNAAGAAAGAALPLAPVARDINVRYSELVALLPAIAEQARRAGVEFMWYSPTPVCVFNPVAHGLGNKGCAACDGLLSVSPTGDVLPCSSWPESVGNLLAEPFTAIWRSRRGAGIRAKECAPAGCEACEEFALCQGACPLYWRHFGCAEIVGMGGCHVAAGG